MSRSNLGRLFVVEIDGDGVDDVVVEWARPPWPHVARFSDRSAISRSCRGLMSVCVSKCVFKFDL